MVFKDHIKNKEFRRLSLSSGQENLTDHAENRMFLAWVLCFLLHRLKPPDQSNLREKTVIADQS